MVNCKNHPSVEAVAACIECGNFVCSQCLTVVKRKNYCLDCVKKILEDEPVDSGKPVVFQQQQQQQQQQGSSTPAVVATTPTDWANVISWILSVIFFLGTLSELSRGSVAFLWAFIVALLWLPPLNEWLKKEKNIEIPLWIKIGSTIILLALMGLTTKKVG